VEDTRAAGLRAEGIPEAASRAVGLRAEGTPAADIPEGAEVGFPAVDVEEAGDKAAAPRAQEPRWKRQT